MNRMCRICGLALLIAGSGGGVFAQGHTERTLPAEWKKLAEGARFIDRFLPMPIQQDLTADTWGAEGVLPRDITNGIEERDWSYWGGNILKGEDGLYHMYVCRWPENHERGFRGWQRSIVVHATSKSRSGPFTVRESIGRGHNPEAYRLNDGRVVVAHFVNGMPRPDRYKYYIADSFDGPWEQMQMEFDMRGWPPERKLSNLSFAKREDGSILMVSRDGVIWLSRTGVSPFERISHGSVYPVYEGEYEDPVLWKTDVQYHLIVHDWKGRVAYHLRSKDGFEWKVDPGEAYTHEISTYENGKREQWYKYERIKVFQDEYGRAVQANFGVLDVPKSDDLMDDNHGSKNLCIPLEKGRLLEIVFAGSLKDGRDVIRLKIKAEADFDPLAEINVPSLRLGAPEKVDYGRGCRPIGHEVIGRDLIVTFSTGGQWLSKRAGK